MNHFLSFFSSLLLFFHHPPVPTPTPIVFHPYPPSSISVNWNSPDPGHTIFTIANFLPGDSSNRSITVTNNSPSSRPLTVRGVKVSELKNFSGGLNITIFKNNSVIYGPKLLSQFLSESSLVAGVPLGIQNGHTAATYKFLVEFPASSGNEYQQAKITFNLSLGKLLPVPKKCKRFFDNNQNFTVSSKDKHIFASFDSDDQINDHDPNHCSLTRH